MEMLSVLGPLEISANVLTLTTTWATLMTFVALGTFSKFLVSYYTLDLLGDQFKSVFVDTEDAFDFIVVGGGSAGSVLASRLTENGKYTVLVLEAGGEPNPYQHIPSLCLFLLNRPYIDWQYKTTPQENACLAMKNRQCYYPRGKGLGGSSLLNFMIYMRGHPLDFDHWANITEDNRWSYEEVLPFFKKSEDYNGDFYNDKYHARGGPLKVSQAPYYPKGGLGEMFIKASNELGYATVDVNGNYTEGWTPLEYQTRISGSGSIGCPNLFIYKYSHVSKILFRGIGNEAYGVEYWRHGIKRIAHVSKEVIVSAGAVNSPQLLMLSGIGRKGYLERFGIRTLVDLPVGFNLQDHITTGLGPILINETITTIFDRDINSDAIGEFTKFGKGILTTSQMPAGGFSISPIAKKSSNLKWPDLQYFALAYGVHASVVTDYALAFNIREDVISKFFLPHQGKDSFQIIISVARPKSRGRIQLASSDPFDPPIINPKYFAEEQDLATLLEGVKTSLRLVETTKTFQGLNATLSRIPFPGCESWKYRSDAYWKCFIRSYSLTIYHPSGTCAMGRPTSPDAVVVSELRVLGTNGLRVIDASVMPTITIGNLNAPTIMIGERGAELILDDWEEGR